MSKVEKRRMLALTMFVLLLACVALMVAGFTQGRPTIVIWNFFNALGCLFVMFAPNLTKGD